MQIHLRYRGVIYERSFYVPEVIAEKTHAISQRSQVDTPDQAFVILRYRGIRYIQRCWNSGQSDKIGLFNFRMFNTNFLRLYRKEVWGQSPYKGAQPP